MTATALDAILVSAAAVAALTALLSPGRRGSSLAFLALGVVMSLIWLHLGSVDVALAEAALGTGLMSALLVTLTLDADREAVRSAGSARPRGRYARLAIGLLSAVLLVIAGIGTWLSARSVPLTWSDELDGAMPATGAEHGVTAVLLGFRAYDTLLESAVLMLAGLLILALMRDGRPTLGDPPRFGVERSQTLSWSARLLAPLLLLLGLWLLFAGSSSPGGAFQSGAVLAATAIMLRTAGVPLGRWEQRLLIPALVIGVLTFLVSASIGPLLGGAWLHWPDTFVFPILLTVEVMLTVGIAAGLYLLWIGMAGPKDPAA